MVLTITTAHRLTVLTLFVRLLCVCDSALHTDVCLLASKEYARLAARLASFAAASVLSSFRCSCLLADQSVAHGILLNTDSSATLGLTFYLHGIFYFYHGFAIIHFLGVTGQFSLTFIPPVVLCFSSA